MKKAVLMFYLAVGLVSVYSCGKKPQKPKQKPQPNNQKAVEYIIKWDFVSLSNIVSNATPDFINSTNNGFKSPLLNLAAYKASLDAVKLLLEKGADINGRDSEGRTALFKAVASWSTDIIKFLIEKGADVNAKDTNGDTPLHIEQMFADEGTDFEIVKLLVESGADPNALNNLGETPLYYHLNNPKVVKFLVERMKDIKHFTDKAGNTPLHYAVRKGKLETVKILLESGININSQNKDRETPLHTAVIYGQTNVVEYLIKRGADLNALDKYHHSPIFNAISYISYSSDQESARPYFRCMELLIKNGADLNMKTNPEHPLIYAVDTYEENDIKIKAVEILLKGGADVNITNSSGETPLAVASKRGLVKMVKILLKYRADPNIADWDGRTPLYHSAVNGKKEVLKILLKNGGVVKMSDIAVIMKSQDTETALILIKHFNIHRRDDYGNTLLHYAAEYNCPKVAEALIQMGLKVVETNGTGETPLTIARRKENTEVAEVLQKHLKGELSIK